jgi:hypothetical protein
LSRELEVPVPHDDHLKGWKEIGAHLHASDRTVQRWERLLHLPVRRLRSGGGLIVFASRQGLDAWLESVEGQTALREREGAAPAVDATTEVPGPLAATPTDIAISATGDTASPAGAGEPEQPIPETSGPISRRWRWSTLAAVPVLGAVALFASVATTGDSRRTAKSVPTPPVVNEGRFATSMPPAARSVRVHVIFANGARATVGVAYGGIAEFGMSGGVTYTLSADRMPSGARLHLSKFDEGPVGAVPRQVELAGWSLRFGELIAVQNLPGLTSLQIEDRPPSDQTTLAPPRSNR